MESTLSARRRGDSSSSFGNQRSDEKFNHHASKNHSAGHYSHNRNLENEHDDNSPNGNAVSDSNKSFGKSVKNDTNKSEEVSSHENVSRSRKIQSERSSSDGSSNKVEYRQRHSSGSKIRENSLNRNIGVTKISHSDKGQIKDSDMLDAEKTRSDYSKRGSTEVLVSSGAINRSSSVDKKMGKSTTRNPSNDRIRKRQDSPRNSFADPSRRGQASPRRNLSSDRSRRMQDASNDRSRKGNVSADRTTKGQGSPRRTVMVQKAPKGIDTSLALGDLEGSDDDDCESPRKSSPRKEIGSGLMQTTKSFEAKTSLIRRRDSDGSLTKSGQKQSNLFKNEVPSKPFIKKSLSHNPIKMDFIRKHSTGEDDDNDKTQTNELNEQKPILNKSLYRSSSGRKLPTPNEHLRSLNSTLRKSTSDVNEQLINVKETSKVENDDVIIHDKSSQTDTYKTVNYNGTKITPSSPRENKVNLRRSVSLEIQQSDDTSSRNEAEATVVSKKPPSPRDRKPAKPPLEKKISARSMSASAVPASPRGNTVPSPRGTKPPSPRGNKPPSPRNVSRTTVPSPRGSSVPSPRGSYRSNELVRKASLERAENSDKGLTRRNSGSNLDSHSKELVRRPSSGNFRSPRNSSPTKAGRKVFLKVDVLEVNGIDNCMDLEAMLAKAATSAVEKEETEQVISLDTFYANIMTSSRSGKFA